MSHSIARLFPVRPGSPLRIISFSLLFSAGLFYLLQYLPQTLPGYKLPEFPVLLLLILVTPLLFVDIFKHGYRFMCKPREGQYLYTLGLSRLQRTELVSAEVRATLDLFLLFNGIAVVTLILGDILFLKDSSLSTFLFSGILLSETFLLRLLLLRYLKKGAGLSSRDSVSGQSRGIAFSQKRITGFIRKGSKILVSLFSRNEAVFVKRLWIYLFRNSFLYFGAIQGTILLGAILFLYFLSRGGEEYSSALFLIPPVGFILSLSSTLGVVQNAIQRLRLTYYTFSHDVTRKGLLLFAITFAVPYGVLLIFTMCSVEATLKSIVPFGNSLLVVLFHLLLFIRLQLKGWKGDAIPLWYILGTLFAVLISLLSWGGTLTLSIVLLVLCFENKLLTSTVQARI